MQCHVKQGKLMQCPVKLKYCGCGERGGKGCGHPPAETCKGLALPSLAFVLASLEASSWDEAFISSIPFFFFSLSLRDHTT